MRAGPRLGACERRSSASGRVEGRVSGGGLMVIKGETGKPEGSAGPGPAPARYLQGEGGAQRRARPPPAAAAILHSAPEPRPRRNPARAPPPARVARRGGERRRGLRGERANRKAEEGRRGGEGRSLARLFTRSESSGGDCGGTVWRPRGDLARLPREKVKPGGEIPRDFVKRKLGPLEAERSCRETP